MRTRPSAFGTRWQPRHMVAAVTAVMSEAGHSVHLDGLDRYSFAKATDTSPMWPAGRVQREAASVAALPHLANTQARRALLVYRNMCARRDLQRQPGGELAVTDPYATAIGDHLADTMSRLNILSVAVCSTDEAADCASSTLCPVDFGLCRVIIRMIKEPGNSLEQFADYFNTYLGTHMKLCLSAVIRDDAFWDVMPDTRCRGTADKPAVLQARLRYVRKNYQRLYDKNNAFLGKRVDDVVRFMAEQGFIEENDVLEILSLLTEKTGLSNVAFTFLRNNITWRAALDLAANLPSKDHPLLQPRTDGAGWTISVPEALEKGARVPPIKEQLWSEKLVRMLLKLPSATTILRLLGSKGLRR